MVQSVRSPIDFSSCCQSMLIRQGSHRRRLQGSPLASRWQQCFLLTVLLLLLRRAATDNGYRSDWAFAKHTELDLAMADLALADLAMTNFAVADLAMTNFIGLNLRVADYWCD